VKRRVAVVGGGLSGLAAAHHLLTAVDPLDVVVLEGAPRAGGIVSTARDGAFVLEDGPDSFLTEKPEALALIDRLGLTDRLQGTRPEFRRSFVVRHGRLVPTPDGFSLLAPARLGPVLASPLFSPLGKLRIALEPFIPALKANADADFDESLASFVTRRLGPETLERIAQPMVGGIYGADPAELSLAATFPRFLALERAHGSVIRGLARGRTQEASGARYGLFASLEGGMGTLIDALLARVPVRTSTRVETLAPAAGGGWTVRTRTGDEAFDAVLLALPAYAAADLVAPFDAALGAALGAFSAGSSATLSLAYRAGAIAHPLGGAGFVVPRAEAKALGGLIGGSFTHRKFERRAPEGEALVRLFFGDDALGFPEAELARRGHEALVRLLGAGAPPHLQHAARWPLGMPRYRVGHLGRVRTAFAAAAAHRGLALAGNSYTGVGIPDCIRSGEEAARVLAAQLASGVDAGVGAP
jgi:protoporphyrinogen/coproporphyrinogen III oxidase